MVDKTSLGAVGEPFPVRVELGKVGEFAVAVLSDDPAHFEGEHPVSPATFLTSDFFWKARVPGADVWPKVAMSEERGMHAEQEFVFFGPPPRAGDLLTGQSRIDSITEKTSRRGERLQFVVMVTEYRDAEGRRVAESRMTGVERWPAEGADA